MNREYFTPRSSWDVEDIDFANMRHADGRDYWVENACYVFSGSEIARLDAAAREMLRLIDAAVERAFATVTLARLGIPECLHAAAARSWRRRDPTLYGRFDFVLDSDGTPKLLEFNADTPTALYEAAIIQWRWLQHRDSEADQYNRIHEKLVERFRELGASLSGALHFTCMQAERDDRLTTHYLRDCAGQAGLQTECLDISNIGVRNNRVVDLRDTDITHLFKLYPTEWIANEEFGDALMDADIGLLEPPWRLAASSKMLLADLWEMFPEHENLLPAYRNTSGVDANLYLAKAAFGREGDGVRQARTPPNGPCVFQKRLALQSFDGRYPVLGIWIAGDEPCGMGVREDVSPITSCDAFFVPHRIGG